MEREGTRGTLESGEKYIFAQWRSLVHSKTKKYAPKNSKKFKNEIKTCIIGYLTIKYKVKWYIFIL
jgi:hypothetical protein